MSCQPFSFAVPYPYVQWKFQVLLKAHALLSLIAVQVTDAKIALAVIVLSTALGNLVLK